jgi:hypothetical protein
MMHENGVSCDRSGVGIGIGIGFCFFDFHSDTDSNPDDFIFEADFGIRVFLLMC